MQISNEIIYTVGFVVCFFGFIAMFKRPIIGFLSRANKIQFKLSGILIEAPVPEFLKMYEKMYSRLLRPPHIDFFREVVKKNEPPRVIDMIPGFNRDSEEWIKSDEGREMLGMLRALRGLGFIEPEERGKWKSDKHIGVTEFGREMYRYMKP